MNSVRTTHPRPSQNWSGNVTFKPAKVVHPKTIAELQKVISENKKIRVVGSKHSFNKIADTDDTWIDLSSLNLPMTFPSASEVEVPAAMPLHELNSRLADAGRALASIGDIDEQHVGGLIATGTHGSGLAFGTMSDLVTAVKLVSGRGCFLKPRKGRVLAAARTHLGAFGALVSVTLQTCPAHNLERRRSVMPIAKVLTPEFMRAHDHTQLFYFPFTEGMYVRTLHRTNRPVSSWWTLGPGRWIESVKENGLVKLLLYPVKWFPTLTPWLMQCMQSMLDETNDVAPSCTQMTSVRTMKYHELEMALDLEHMPAAFAEVRNIIESLAKREPASGRFYAHLPVTIRAVKGRGNNFLSPTLGRDTVYISVTSRVGFKHYELYFKEVEEVLSKRFNARPHWGKHQWINPVGLYKEAERFRRVCRKLDPEGKFRNEFVESKIFAASASASATAASPASQPATV